MGTFEGSLEINAFAERLGRHEPLLRPEVLQATIDLFHVPLSLDLLHPVLIILKLGRRCQVLLLELNRLLFCLWRILAIID